MAFRIESPRGSAESPSPSVIAAIFVALDASLAPIRDLDLPSRASAWRAAGRSIEAFDAYDAARYAHVARRARA